MRLRPPSPALVRGRAWRAIGYESLVQRPQLVFDNLCGWLGVPSVDVGEIFDANERYFGPSDVRESDHLVR